MVVVIRKIYCGRGGVLLVQVVVVVVVIVIIVVEISVLRLVQRWWFVVYVRSG